MTSAPAADPLGSLDFAFAALPPAAADGPEPTPDSQDYFALAVRIDPDALLLVGKPTTTGGGSTDTSTRPKGPKDSGSGTTTDPTPPPPTNTGGTDTTPPPPTNTGGTDTTPPPPSTLPPYHLMVSRAADFIGSLGVNTHMGNAAYGDAASVLDQLNFIGVHRIRDWFPESVWPLQYAQLGTLTSSGVKLDALLPNINPVDLTGHLSALTAFVRAHPGTVTSIEGPNEIDASPIVYRGLNGIAAVQALQQDLFAAVKGTAELSSIPVYNFTTGWRPQSDYGIGDMSPYADYANVHGYVPNGMRPADWLPGTINSFTSNMPGKSIILTETNYYTLPLDSNWGGVNENVQAKYGLYTALDDWNAGIAATFFYELRDEAADQQREHNFGLFHADGTPKTFAIALHNLAAILGDTGPAANSFQLNPVTVSFSGLPSTAAAHLLQKSDGSSDLVVWNEQQIWDPVNHVQLVATTADVTVVLDRSFSTVEVYDPLVSASPLATYHGVSQFTVHLADGPLVFHLI
ncbi:hypothetical protein [Falsiroseomonas sp. HW251]|uniref:hypothetical protein n=1 Tax=Falsiroseomonas sp. HW251 TaxID=3390998 RepID=UPI003D321594